MKAAIRTVTLRGVRLVLLMAASAVLAQSNENVENSAEAANTLTLDGLVTTHMGAGVSEAKVRIDLPDASPNDPPLAQTVTGRRGEVLIEIPRPKAQSLRYRVTAEGFAGAEGTLDISDPNEPPFLDVTLHGAASVWGRITTAGRNTPVSGAQVQMRNGGHRTTVQTGPDGRFRFDSAYAGPALITVTAPGFGTYREQVQIEDDDVKLHIELGPERPVELTLVTNTGRPAADVLVEAVTEPQQIFLMTRADANGKAKLSGVGIDCAGLNLRFNGESYLTMRGYEEHLPLPAKDDRAATATRPAPVEAEFTVTLASRVRGTVTDKQTGKPIRNVRVLAGREPRYDTPMDWSGPGGSYELLGVQPGDVTVTFQHEDYATAFAEIELQAGQTGTLDVALERGVAIGGTVVDDQGQPVDQVRVVADRWNGYETLGLRAITDRDGRFELPHVPPGNIEFTFVRPGYGKPLEIELTAGKTDHVIKLASVDVPRTADAPSDQAKLKVGEPVADLVMIATDGTTYRLSELRGKYVFLDCWASWCRPCIAEIPNVKALHEATKNRPDFVLIGISLDTDAKALKRACDEHGITWPQVVGPKSGAAEAFEELDGVGIPYTCLIGPDGKLEAQHLRGPGMVEEVRKALPSVKSGDAGR
ncbi:MAG TPA: carboxypeptidase regulatory-like domain-containing protein [Phycisphaerae bacterium]|nr:carboxypeptidase regulatory-like domain-containing protein [Phycisphaerae bacterium]